MTILHTKTVPNKKISAKKNDGDLYPRWDSNPHGLLSRGFSYHYSFRYQIHPLWVARHP